MHNQEHHHFAYHLLKNKELDDFYVSFALKSFAASLVTIFIPIYLLKLGFLIQDVAIYYIIAYTSISAFFPLFILLNSRIGVKKTMSLGIILSILYYISLNYIGNGISYHLVALIFGISVALYYAGYHIQFTNSIDRGKEGKEVSIVRSIKILIPTLGPLIGSLFISEISFRFLFLIVSILLFLATLPLFFTKDRKTAPVNLSLKKILHSDTKRKALCYQADGIIKLASRIFWPVFIFLILHKVLSVGIIMSVASLVTVLFVIWIGKWADRDNEKTLSYAVLFHAPSWIIRLLFLTPLGIFINNLYAKMTSAAVDIPFYKKVYKKAEEITDLSNYFIFRELNLEVGRVTLLLIALFTGKVKWVFVFAFFITFVYLLIVKNNPIESKLTKVFK